MTSTSFDDFASMQSTWKSEIQEQFLKFKREESVSQLLTTSVVALQSV